jgi:tRNA C32,U32 (ribose-2'-O)-methylase TrmJ
MGKQRQPHYRVDEIMPRLAGMVRHDPRGEVVLLFGREADGLHDRELDQCTHLAYIPTSEAYPATNLAQAVAIVAYELSRAIDAAVARPHTRPSAPRTDAEEIDDALADHARGRRCTRTLEESSPPSASLKDGQRRGDDAPPAPHPRTRAASQRGRQRRPRQSPGRSCGSRGIA